MKKSFLHLSIALGVFVLSLVMYGISYGIIASKSAAVASVQNQIDAKLATRDRIASARAALSEIAGDEAAIRAYFVSQSTVVSFIDDLEGRARALGASASVISVTPSAAGEHPTITLALTVAGTFDSVMRSIGAMEFAPYDLSITKVSAGKDGKSSWHANLTIIVASAQDTASSTTP